MHCLSRVALTVPRLTLAALLMTSVSVMAQDYSEAPELADRVASGDLPPVEERLPANPMVVEPFETVGQYGGTWRLVMNSPSDISTLARTIGYENFVRSVTWQPGIEQEDILPDVIMNVAEDVEISEDGTEYTFHLREGHKWSDGEPFTADDVMFWYENVYSNTQLFPAKPTWSVRNGEPLVVEKIDDTTVKFKFGGPSGLLLQYMSTPSNDAEQNQPFAYPRHYLSQFHPDHNPDAASSTWVQDFHAKADMWRNPEMPRLHPWIITQGIGQGSGAQVIAERNPYYFKVDTEGNQLPYFDRVTVDIITDAQVTTLKAANGDFDMLDSYVGFVATPENRGTFFDNQEKGGYEFYEVLPNRANLMIISLNMTHKDPVLRELFANKTFRQALSTAVDRDEVIELVWLGQGRPYQTVERPESPLFDEEMATQFTDFDIARANEMLDSIGLTEKDGNGIRLMSDGRPLQFTIDISVIRQPWIDSAELIKGYWRQIGVDLLINTSDTTALNQRVESNEHDAAVWSASGGADSLFDPKYYFPYSWAAFYATTWGQWFTNDTHPEEPSEAAKRQMDLYQQVFATVDAPTRLELMRELMTIAKEEFYTIGVMQPTSDYGIVNRLMGNFPGVLLASTEYAHPGAANPEQFYYEAE
ncbi:ABC transporter substrate-binding protein [Devosia honganensis]|uniref:ABC transporter substrate-binding protein n=1 Tax=Devosia honganensis TaxID=1610527 RepID=A0ABV7X3G0_9HYPH